MEAAFGRPLEHIFASFEATPVASGSIAQVHRATLIPDSTGADVVRLGRRTPDFVAVKVRHPGVANLISRDFAILRVIAELAGVLPGLAWMRLEDSVRQFREPLFEQVDLSREAHNLRLFNQNFASWRHVSFPRPIDTLVQPAVLVETFEQGSSISNFLQADDPEVRDCFISDIFFLKRHAAAASDRGPRLQTSPQECEVLRFDVQCVQTNLTPSFHQ